MEKLKNPKIPKSTTSLDKHHLLGDQDKAEAAFPTRALSGIPQDLVWELSLFAVGGALSLSSIGRPQDPIAVLPSLILVAGVWVPPCCIPPFLLWKKKEKRSEFNLRGCSSCGGRAPIRQSDPLPMAGGRAPRKIQIQIQNICPCAPSQIQI